MDDFTVHGDSFDGCLHHLTLVLKHFIETDLVVNFEKCHFMVEHGVVLGHVVSSKGLEVHKAKVDIIQSLPYPKCIKEVRSFQGHVGFDRRFIKDFSKIASPLCALLAKDALFNFNENCGRAFDQLKLKLTTTLIVQAPNWALSFELMYDATDKAAGVVLGQRVRKVPHVSYYASTTLDLAQCNYTTIEKEVFAVVFALEKFHPYLLGVKVIVYTDNSAIKHLLSKNDSKPRLIRWVVLLQEFQLEIKDKPRAKNLVADHISRPDGKSIERLFPY